MGSPELSPPVSLYEQIPELYQSCLIEWKGYWRVAGLLERVWDGWLVSPRRPRWCTMKYLWFIPANKLRWRVWCMRADGGLLMRLLMCVRERRGKSGGYHTRTYKRGTVKYNSVPHWEDTEDENPLNSQIEKKKQKKNLSSANQWSTEKKKKKVNRYVLTQCISKVHLGIG